MMNSFIHYWNDVTLAGNDAAITINARVQHMLAKTLKGDMALDPEMQRMTQEKIQAGNDGAFAAAQASLALLWTLPLYPQDWLNAYVGVTHAAQAPAFATVRHNATRLATHLPTPLRPPV